MAAKKRIQPGRDWITVGEVGKRLGMSPSRVRAAIERGDLVGGRWSSGGRYYVDPTSVEALRRKQAERQDPSAPPPLNEAETKRAARRLAIWTEVLAEVEAVAEKVERGDGRWELRMLWPRLMRAVLTGRPLNVLRGHLGERRVHDLGELYGYLRAYHRDRERPVAAELRDRCVGYVSLVRGGAWPDALPDAQSADQLVRSVAERMPREWLDRVDLSVDGITTGGLGFRRLLTRRALQRRCERRRGLPLTSEERASALRAAGVLDVTEAELFSWLGLRADLVSWCEAKLGAALAKAEKVAKGRGGHERFAVVATAEAAGVSQATVYRARGSLSERDAGGWAFQLSDEMPGEQLLEEIHAATTDSRKLDFRLPP